MVALLLDHIVVLPGCASEVEVLALDDPLRASHLPADHLRVERIGLPLGQEPFGDQPVDAKTLQERIFQADEEPALTRITLSTGSPSKLVIDAPALVPVGADDVEASESDHRVALTLGRATQPDVGASSGHVGGNRDGAQLPGFGDNRGFVFDRGQEGRVVKLPAGMAGDDEWDPGLVDQN